MSRARALLVLLATLVLAWLTTPSALAGSPSPSPVHGYSYNSQLSDAQFSDAAGERGPSSTIYDHQNNAVPHGVRGATARPGAAAVSRFGAHRTSSPHAYDGSVSSTPVTGRDAAAETSGGALHRTIACSAANRVAAKTALPEALTIGKNAETGVNVYTGVREGKDVYVGITNSLARRGAAHGDRFAIERLTDSSVTRGEARAIEQAQIVRNPGFENIRNSISPDHPWYQQGVDWGEGWLQAGGH
jgi:hypothetical protein